MYELALHFNPQCAEACNNLGVIYKDRDNLDKAVECYQVPASSCAPLPACLQGPTGVVRPPCVHAFALSPRDPFLVPFHSGTLSVPPCVHALLAVPCALSSLCGWYPAPAGGAVMGRGHCASSPTSRNPSTTWASSTQCRYSSHAPALCFPSCREKSVATQHLLRPTLPSDVQRLLVLHV